MALGVIKISRLAFGEKHRKWMSPEPHNNANASVLGVRTEIVDWRFDLSSVPRPT